MFLKDRGGKTPRHRYALTALMLFFALFSGWNALWLTSLAMLIIGCWLLCKPPVFTPGRRFDVTVMVMLAFCLLYVLPIDWFPGFINRFIGRPEWWFILSNAGLKLPATLAPQPILALESMLPLFAAIAWVYVVWSWRFEEEDIRRLLWLILAALTPLGILLTAHAMPATHGLATNLSIMNNVSVVTLLLSAGCVIGLGLGVMSLLQRSPFCLLAFLGGLVCLTALIFNLWTTGLIYAGAGCLFWYVIAQPLLGFSKLFRWGVLALLIVGGFSVMQVLEHLPERERVLTELATPQKSVVTDSFSMAKANSTVGVSPGSFADVLLQYRDHTDANERPQSPGSSWLLALTEYGLPGMAILICGLTVPLLFLIPFGIDRMAMYRSIAVAVLALYVVASFLMDVVQHLPVFLTALLFFRLALPPIRVPQPNMFSGIYYRIAGLMLTVTGVAWLSASLGNVSLHSSIALEKAHRTINDASEQADFETVAKHLETAQFYNPLNWRLYLWEGKAQLLLARQPEAAREPFAIARRLEPDSYFPPFEEGVAWMSFSQRMARDAWEVAMARTQVNQIELFERMIEIGSRFPQFQANLSALSRENSDLRIRYLNSIPIERFLEEIAHDRETDPHFAQFTLAQRVQLFDRWTEVSDVNTLLIYALDHHEPIPEGWYYLATAYASTNQFEAAIETVASKIVIIALPEAARLIEPPDNLPKVEDILTRRDRLRAMALLNQLLEAGDTARALQLARNLVEAENPPPYARYWLGELNRRQDNYRDAWVAWQPLLLQQIGGRMQPQTLQVELEDASAEIDISRLQLTQ